jgi:hypothetical protein
MLINEDIELVLTSSGTMANRGAVDIIALPAMVRWSRSPTSLSGASDPRLTNGSTPTRQKTTSAGRMAMQRFLPLYSRA